ncbi:hypothetical protein H6F44_09775 [Pseudanabaena sp. FACHB-1277]|jgi:hypothetical protein|uniref:Uncharacterized protein n=1 Tax=Pseudanabaena cinerea FACHB-1277 TaxID=2949581 RepID=A0A926USS4_9CYAN|nr:hypothetical protein [Pseudanabaena cinerea]MBD2150404.1 hypothetical protein [Pseudanabaena cinerea FACHB-1277]
MNDTLTESQWQSAHKIAIELIKSETDPNEVSKANSYLRSMSDRPDAISRFFKYISTLVSSGNQIGHSKKTVEYYRNIAAAYKEYLSDQDNPQVMLQILGWTSRLMRYYKTAPIAERDAKLQEKAAIADNQAQRLAEIKASVKSQVFELGKIVDAKVVNKTSGNKVTYEIVGTSIRNTIKEPKMFDKLEIDQIVKVQINEIDDGIPKKFKRVD